ncbi:phage portal protein [Weissella tructae]|uniref:phage portal protein n=1 Tax=Weissella tructae TaxID=887702 RepID=UPI003D8DC429
MGVVQTLNKITDHPDIGVAEHEYSRIADNLQFFKGEFPQVAAKNGYGRMFKRDYVSLNMAQVLCRRLSSMMVNEQMTVSIEDNSAADAYANEVLTNNDFIKNFERYLESAMALGGLAMRPYADGDKIKISFIQAPVFYPLRSNANDISEAAIATKTVTVEGQKKIYWTLLEFHKWSEDNYIVSNELYRSEVSDSVGVEQSLTANRVYEDLQPETIMTGLERPLFVYLKPFGFNNKDITSPLGLSVFDNARNTLKFINDTYDQYNWEVKMGQRRVLVPQYMMESVDEQGGVFQFFDPSQNVFTGVNTNADADIADLTTDIRSNEFIATLNQGIKTLEMQTGLSAGTFSFDGNGLKTATEVISENSMTYQTRNSHLNNVERSIQELVISILELAKLNGLYAGEIPDLYDITVDFDDGVFLDKNSQLDYYAKASSAKLISKQYAIQKAFDMNEEDAIEQIKLMNAESMPVMTDIDSNMYPE